MLFRSERLQSCEMLVLVYPTWWGAQPAILKGWFDRVWANGVAYDVHEDGSAPTPRLANVTRVIAITTHGSSKLVNSLQGEAGKRFVKRSLRVAVSRRCRISWLALYGLDRAGASDRERFVRRVSERLARTA